MPPVTSPNLEDIAEKASKKTGVKICSVTLLVAFLCCCSGDNNVFVDVEIVNSGKTDLIGVGIELDNKELPVGGLAPGQTAVNVAVVFDEEKILRKRSVTVFYLLAADRTKEVLVRSDLEAPDGIPKELRIDIDHQREPAVRMQWIK